MTKLRLGRLLWPIILLVTPFQGLHADAAGVALAQRVYDRPDGDDVVSIGLMILTEEGRAPRERLMYGYSRDTDAGDFWSLIRFGSPAKIEDTGLLSRDMASGSEDQWLFLPALKRTRRIASNRKGGRFVGSDLFYEDLQDRKVAEDDHRITGSDKVNGKPCTLLESVPVDPNNSAYSKRVSCIDEETLIALRVDFYTEGKETPVKRSTVAPDGIKRVQGFWTVLDSTMSDLASGHQTRVTVDRIKYDQGLPEDLFSRKALEDPTREERYRP